MNTTYRHMIRLAKKMITTLRLVCSVITARLQRDYGSFAARLRLTISMLLFLVLGSGNVLAQTDLTDYYYIAVNGLTVDGVSQYNAGNPSENYYLCPTLEEGWIYYQATNNYTTTPNGKPFMTTYQWRDGVKEHERKAMWKIEKAPAPNSDFYYIKYSDHRYLVANGQISSAGANRLRLHLETMVEPDDRALYKITKANEGYYYIQPKNYSKPVQSSDQYLNITQGNRPYLTGDDSNLYVNGKKQDNRTDGPSKNQYKINGTIGLYTSPSEFTSRFYLEVIVPRPTITINASGQVFIEESTGSNAIYYTTDGSEPTNESTPYNPEGFPLTAGMQTIKAIAYNAGLEQKSMTVSLELTTTFHVVNKSNAIALTMQNDHVTSLNTVPSEIKSPYIPDDSQYKFFSSKAEAYAYSSATTDDARDAAAAQAFTTITQNNQTVYVGYYYDETRKPADLPVLDGTKWYQMIDNGGGVDNDIYSVLNADNYPEHSSAATHNTGDFTNSNHLWHFIGGDPYDIRVANLFMNDFKKAEGGEWLIKQNSSITDDYRTLDGYHKDEGASMVMLRYDADHYCLAIVSNSEQVGTSDYLFFFGSNSQNSGEVRFMQNNSADSPTYVSDRDGAHLQFMPISANYTYYIVNKNNNVAIQSVATGQPVGTPLGYDAIPEGIRSAYLQGEELTFYSFDGDYDASKINDGNIITRTPLTEANIYVKYTTDHLMDKFLHLRGERAFNIKVDAGYLYDDNGMVDTRPGEEQPANTESKFMWYFAGLDPYAVIVKNAQTDKYLTYTSTWTISDSEPSTKFILMPGSVSKDESIIKLLAASGRTPATSTSAEIDIDVVEFSATYNLIDKAGKLIERDIVNSSGDLALPDEWKSPMVSTYHFWKTSGLVGDTYKPEDEIFHIADAGGDPIYVTYDVGNTIDLDGRNSLNIEGKENKTYMLKFINGEMFNQEDGLDGIMDIERKAVYPYSNGDAALYVYGQERWEKQLADGASTRSRWLWYIEPANTSYAELYGLDPYHVKISSYQDQTNYKVGDEIIRNFHSYLRTYQPEGYEHVVTGVTNNNPLVTGGEASDPANSSLATEYMIIGSNISHCRLKTVEKIGDERRTVNSFEQYWKNSPTVKGILSTAVTTEGRKVTLTSTQKEEIVAKGWHVYEEWANSAPWVNNGDEPATTSKKFLKEEHCFQTITVGEEFSLEEIELTPVLILLDQHGWEITRITLPSGPTDPNRAARYAAIHKYSSPMVKTYHFYKTASKVPGYHKYRVDLDSYATVSDVDPTEYTADELGRTDITDPSTPPNLPNYATQAVVGGKERDWYVTYDVKDQYAHSYKGAAKVDKTIASAFMLIQGDGYATTANGETITTTTEPTDLENVPEEMQWYLRPNFNIDDEMGYKYAGETGAQEGAKSKTETDQENYDNGLNGFDPYNLQIQNMKYPLRYFTANTTGSTLSSGRWTGTSSSIDLQPLSYTRQSPIGNDQAVLSISNTTFMVVDDGNGNMRLMPRFDNNTVMTSFASLSTQLDPAPAGDQGAHTQSLWFGSAFRTVQSTDEILDMTGKYFLAEGFIFRNTIGSAREPFSGIIDGKLNTVSGISQSFVNYASGATLKNIILDNVSISSGSDDGNVGAICNEATGNTRIYNCGVLASGSTIGKDKDGYDVITTCSSTVSGSNYVGGIVGLLDGTSRVINCFSYADIRGGSYVGGIVGWNNVATTSANLKTMVMNCMFYGNISGATHIAPIYNGEIITNRSDQSGVSNFNYFRSEAPYVVEMKIETYNCALMAETRFLQRFEFFRHLLNSNRALAAWWATGNVANKDQMMKWVLEPSQIGTATPYPVLKNAYDDEGIIKYPSVVNIDAANAPTTTERNKGGKLRTLNVTIQMGTGNPLLPSTASLTTTNLTLNVIDKDPDHFNYNYYKVQLPYYNDVGDGNYNENRVVTGWKIVAVTTDGSVSSYNDFTTGSDATVEDGVVTAMPYNFADRNCTNKDLYSTSNRVFAQGAYWDVPEGVTAITIEPYWAKCVYLSDEYYDIVYNQNMSDGGNVTTTTGRRYSNNTIYEINGSSQKVYTKMSDAETALAPSGTVYDNAIVLVGNFHRRVSNNNAMSGDNPFTIMSIDLDKDNEPDNCYILRTDGRNVVHPARADFLNIIGLGMAQKSTDGTGSYNLGIMKPKDWFEATNTSLFRVTQLEYDQTTRGDAPIILQGGVIEQWVSNNDAGVPGNHIQYIHIGGNVWFKEFHLGIHQDATFSTPHPPVSVTGGGFAQFNLTGMYRADANVFDDNAECYINGGYFGTMAGTGYEGLGTSDGNGNIFWQIDNADIDEFYGGSINAAKPAIGNIYTIIKNSYVGQFCGGPKFGNMSAGKTVTTTATNCIFGTYFGAGYGGNSYSRQAPYNHNNIINFPHKTDKAGDDASWNAWLSRFYKQGYSSTYGGVSTQFDYQFLPMSNNYENVARIFVEYVKFDLARTNNVTSNLTGCTIENNFYGGGNLGAVTGDATSTLTDCIVKGNAYGAGYSATLPTVEVDSLGFRVEPWYYTEAGTYRTGQKGATTTYHWEHRDVVNSTETAIDTEDHILYTTEDLTQLGVVQGNTYLTIAGTTTVGTIAPNGLDVADNTGMVFGGGDESNVMSNTTVTMNNGHVLNRVYGGGNKGSIGTFTLSPLNEDIVVDLHVEVVETHEWHDGCIRKPVSLYTENTGKCTVTINNGIVGPSTLHMPYDYGYVFGAGRGVILNPAVDQDIHFRTYVNDTEVTVNGGLVKGGVYGGSESGHVLKDCYVTINGGQIGCGRETTEAFPESIFELDTPPLNDEGNPKNLEASAWEYGSPWLPYDIYATMETPDARPVGTDGHTFFGNVFGGGSGYYPYKDAEGNEHWLRTAGRVEGDTYVEITGGHILTSVYGGNEQTDVLGDCHVTISGGSVGVPRTLQQIIDHPVTCYVFGGGKGDQRTYFNNWTNVQNTTVTVSGGRIFGSVFGGGEDGHVVGNTQVNISGGTDGTNAQAIAGTITKIGNWGTSYVDGNIFGGGRGFSGVAITAGGIGGDAEINITGGHMLGSVYGGGRLASVGSYFVPVDDERYGTLKPDDTSSVPPVTHGHITINISGGIIGNDYEYVYNPSNETKEEMMQLTEFDAQNRLTRTKGGNVFAGCMGRFTLLDGSINPVWNRIAQAKTTELNITGGLIKSNVYGGGEMGKVGVDVNTIATTINMTGGTVGTTIMNEDTPVYSYGSVFGGSFGSGEEDFKEAGAINGNTQVNITGGTVKVNVYGGGNFAKVLGNSEVNIGNKKVTP